MDLVFEERLSDSPFVETIWRSRSEKANPFISMADSHYAMVVAKFRGKTAVTVRGPETKATLAQELPDVEFFGIRFKHGVFMSCLPVSTVIDRQDLNLPEATSKSFWLNGSAWTFPDYENADTFVDRLRRDQLLVYDPVVGETLKGQPVDLSLRTVQRRFLHATGLTQNTMYQIERARYATNLLKQSVPIQDTVYQAGYFDQPHLTRSLKHFIGLTPARVMDSDRSERLSFLYKTKSLPPATIQSQTYEQSSIFFANKNFQTLDMR
jgi:AraC-like DNA-binding protein